MPHHPPDRLTKALLTLVALLLAAHLVFPWGANGERTVRAAGIPDSGAQMQNIADELKSLNGRVEALQKFLESGSLTVTAKTAEKDRK